jgi:hypothetical protein
MRWRLPPRFKAGEGDERPRVERAGGAVLLEGENGIVALHALDAGQATVREEEIVGTFETSPGSSGALVLRSTHEEPLPFPRRNGSIAASTRRSTTGRAGLPKPESRAVVRPRHGAARPSCGC